MLGEQRISVYLVDDQPMIRGALRCLLGQHGPITVVGDCGDVRKALEEIEVLRPDVVVLDITMPELSGVDAIPLVRDASPQSRILMLTHLEGASFVDQSLSAGANGYLSKDSEPAELALAVAAVHRGQPYISPRVARGFLTGRNGNLDDGSPRSRIDSLTRREREVFQLLAVGRSNKEVAKELNISLGTAKKHRENLKRKLQCTSSSDIVRLAIREGLLRV